MSASDGAGNIRLSVVIPGYNEQMNIRGAVERCTGALDELGIAYEIIIIDDASPDDTGAIAEAMAAGDPRVRVIHNPINLNVGMSILIGYHAARGDLVTHNAMDLPFDPKELARILPLFDDSELAMVVVARTSRAAHSSWRKTTSLVHHWLIRALFWSALPDMNFVQVCRRSAVLGLGVRARSPAFVTPEMIIRARDAGLKIAQVNATFHPRTKGKAKFGKPRDILWVLGDMISFRLEHRAGPRRPRKVAA
jgi:glycosyltransferase involved in cell wall biosynthesis